MSAVLGSLVRSRFLHNPSLSKPLNIRSYSTKMLEYPFEVYCTCTGDFRLKFIVGVDICNLSFKFEKIQVPVEFLAQGFLYVETEYIAGKYRGSANYYKDSMTCIESHTFTSIDDFNNGLGQCSKYLSSISNISLFKSILNGLYLLVRQYSTFSLVFNSTYLSENSASVQGYFKNGKIFLTKVGTLRDTVSTVLGTQYCFKITRKTLGLKQESYLKQIEDDRLIYTSSLDKCMRINISEYSDAYSNNLVLYNSVVEKLSLQKGVDFEVITTDINMQVSTDRLLNSLNLPFMDTGVAPIKRVDTKELVTHSDKMLLSVSFIEVYTKTHKFMGYVHGYNSNTFEVRKSGLIANRLEWQTDTKLKCSIEENKKLNEIISKLSSSIHNEQYIFKINRYTIEKFVRAVDLR